MIALLKRPLVRVVLIGLVVLLAGALAVFQPWLLVVDKTVDEVSPAGSAGVAASFVSHAHHSAGTAKVITAPDGKRTLRLENLDTVLGPDLRIWLSDRPVTADRSGRYVFDDGAHVELGKLKGNKGNQNYAIPDGVDLGTLGTVTLWCKRFHVSFGAASLHA